MICPSCGAENADDAAFCAKCGAKIDPAAPNQSETSPRPAKPEPKPRTIVDWLPNAAESVAWPVAIGIAWVAAFQIAASCSGGSAGLMLSSLFGILGQPLHLVLWWALWNGLRKIGSPASKPILVFMLTSTMAVPVGVLSFGLALLLKSSPDVSQKAMECGGVLLGLIGLGGFISLVVFYMSVEKNHTGRLLAFSKLIWPIAAVCGIGMAIVFLGGMPLAFFYTPLIVCGVILAFLMARLLTAPPAEESNVSDIVKVAAWSAPFFAASLAVCVYGMRTIPADIHEPLNESLSLLKSVVIGDRESMARQQSMILIPRIVKNNFGIETECHDVKNLRSQGEHKWAATAVIGATEELPISIEYKNDLFYVTILSPEDNATESESEVNDSSEANEENDHAYLSAHSGAVDFDNGIVSSGGSPATATGKSRSSSSRAPDTPRIVNNGRELALAVISANTEREANSLRDIWPRYGKSMTKANDYFDSLFEEGLLDGVKPDSAKGWSVFVCKGVSFPLLPFLVSSNVVESDEAESSAVSIVDGCLSLNASDATFGKKIVVITRGGEVLTEQSAVGCLFAGMANPWKLLPAE